MAILFGHRPGRLFFLREIPYMAGAQCRIDGEDDQKDDSKGNEIHYKSSKGYEYWYEYTFWENGTIKTKTTYSTI